MAVDQLASTMQELYVVPPSRNVRESGRRNRNNASLRLCCNGAMEQESARSPHLPDEVLSMILAFLPLMSILRCRLVGKRWNRLLQEALFRETYGRVSGDLSLQYIQLLDKSRGFAGSQLVSSTRGLLLVTSFVEGSDQLFVINPRTATVKRIPTMLTSESSYKHDFSVVGMVMNEEANLYKILAVQEGARPVRFQVYGSDLDAWQWTGAWMVRQPWSWRESTSNLSTYLYEECFNVNVSFHILDVALHDGALHCLSVGAARIFRVLRLEPGSDVWVEVCGLFPPAPSRFVCDFRCKPVLFENKGRLMVAGAQVTEPTSIRVTVWSYEEEGKEWIQVASAQSQIEPEYSDVCGVPYLDDSFFYLDACGDHLCLGAFASIRNPDPKVVLYNIRQDSWLLARRREQEINKILVYWQKRAFFYEPRNFLSLGSTENTEFALAPLAGEKHSFPSDEMQSASLK